MVGAERFTFVESDIGHRVIAGGAGVLVGVSGLPCADLLGRGSQLDLPIAAPAAPDARLSIVWRWPGPPATVDTAEQKPVYQ